LYQKQRQFYITGARRHRQLYRQSIDRLRGWSTELDSADFREPPRRRLSLSLQRERNEVKN